MSKSCKFCNFRHLTECRRLPPQVIPEKRGISGHIVYVTKWPVVKETDFCWEFKPKV